MHVAMPSPTGSFNLPFYQDGLKKLRRVESADSPRPHSG